MRELTIFVNMFPSGGGYAYLKINKEHLINLNSQVRWWIRTATWITESSAVKIEEVVENL